MQLDKIQEILKAHELYLAGSVKGVRADLSGVDLTGANLAGVNLAGVNLAGVNLTGADLRRANLAGANLVGVNLTGANLTGADLTRVNLWNCVGNMRELKSAQLDTYAIVYTATTLQIGCENHAIAEWLSFENSTIKRMDRGASELWVKWKPFIRQMIELSPAIK